jgi:hypothetical protein
MGGRPYRTGLPATSRLVQRISESEFSDFAKAFGGLTHREAHVFYTKHDFWRARAGVSQYHYGA